MSSKAHASLVADLDSTKVTKSLSQVERDLITMGKTATTQFRQLEAAHGKAATAIRANDRAMFAPTQSRLTREKLGQGVMGGAQVAQGFNGAQSAAQGLLQSAQMASAFLGPTGLIIAGVNAAGAALWENVRAQKALTQEARAEATVRDRTRDIQGRQSAEKGDAAVRADIDRMARVSKLGPEAAGMHDRRAELDKQIAALAKRGDLSSNRKAEMMDNLRARAQAQEAATFDMGKRGRQEADVNREADPVLERMRRNGLGSEGRRMEDRAERAHVRERRTAAEQLADREDMRRRDDLGRAEDHDVRPTRNRFEGIKHAREDIMEKSAKAKEGGVMNLSKESIKELVDAIHTLITK